MGIQSGLVSLTYYRVMGDGKTDLSLASINRAFRPFRCRKLMLQGASREEETTWTLPPIDEAFQEAGGEDWDLSHCQVSDGIFLRMQTDRRSVPSTLVQLLLQDRLQKLQASKKRPSTKERRALKAEIHSELISKALPSLTYADAFWQEREERVLLFSVSKKTQRLFEELFEKTFGKTLHLSLALMQPPFLAADPIDLQDTKGLDAFIERWSQAAPSVLSEKSPLKRSANPAV